MFYRDKLGFSLDGLEENQAYLTIGKGAPVLALKSIELVSKEISVDRIRPQEELPIKRSHYFVSVAHVDKEYEDLNEKQVHFVKVPTTRADGWRVAYFEDPEGNLWEIGQPPKE